MKLDLPSNLLKLYSSESEFTFLDLNESDCLYKDWKFSKLINYYSQNNKNFILAKVFSRALNHFEDEN